MKKETLKQAGYKYMFYLGEGMHILKDTETNQLEVFHANKNHASWD